MKRLIEMIAKLMTTRFYGELVIKFEDGKIVSVRETRLYGKQQFN